MIGRPIIFLDIDGTINDHHIHPNGYHGTKWECVRRFNRIIAETDARIVISSSWRYPVLGGHMDVMGFEILLLTHGVDCRGRVAGVTRRDCTDGEADVPPRSDRGFQIREWLKSTFWKGPYVVLDDMDLGITAAGHPFVHVDGDVGLTDADAERAIAILTGREDEDV